MNDDRTAQRVMDKFTVGDGCWEWTAAKSQGSGQVSIAGRLYEAHRVVYEMLVGPIPEGLVLDHLCRNRACVRPDHLEPVTFRENILRGTAPPARQARKTACDRGHPFDDENTLICRGRRVCRACRRLTQERWRNRNADRLFRDRLAAARAALGEQEGGER